MNRSLAVVFASFAVLSPALGWGQTTKPSAGATPTTNPANMNTKLSDASYGIGFNMGKQLAGAPFKLDVDRIVQGLRDANAGKPSAVPDAQLRAAMEDLQQQAGAAAEAKAREQGDVNVKAGDAYRAENGKKPGVRTTASGL